ncbi:MAG: peptide chain release factor N(5)-glutamine methyltransferase [Alistipes sp.]|nr:peptide chain release factor N(5)-glutamine methyltransferase [Alistipes sp.]
MTRRELWNIVQEAASAVYDPQEARAFTAVVCEGRFGMRFTDVIVEPEAPYPDREELPRVLCEIRDHRPAQYIVGYSWLLGHRIAVREGVLIPRPETEELVQRILDRYRTTEGLRVLDAGTGSGCIAVALAAGLPRASVLGVDVSPSALEVARSNGAAQGESLRFAQCDLLHEEPEGLFEVIVSNPPYVTRREQAQMAPNVLQYEPHRALFVEDDDPLLFYRTIARLGQRHLTSGGALWFEINEHFGAETQALLRAEGYVAIQVHRDLFQRERMVEAWWR